MTLSSDKKKLKKTSVEEKDKESRTSSKSLRLIFPLLGFCVIACFLILALEVVDIKQNFTGDVPSVLGFNELLPTPKLYPISKETIALPQLSAKSAIILDADSSIVLYQKAADTRLLPASTTKMMTALVALDNYSLGQNLVVLDSVVEGSKIGLIKGEEISVENLLYGILVGSGNDSAYVLAENYPGGLTAFIFAMNQKAVDLKLENTHFTNPVGYDEENHFSSARDLARLATVVIKNPLLAKIVSTPEITISDVSGETKHQLINTNELVGKINGVRGVKTGWTQNAGECLVSLIEKDNRKVVVALLGSANRFGETKALIDWIFGNFEWQLIFPLK